MQFDPTYLNQVLWNLCDNVQARRAGTGREPILLRTGCIASTGGRSMDG